MYPTGVSLWLNVPLSCPNPQESYPEPNIATGSQVWVIEVDTDPEAIGSMLASERGSVNAWSTNCPVTSRISTPNVQYPVSGGVNQTLCGDGTLLPAVTSKTTESIRELLT